MNLNSLMRLTDIHMRESDIFASVLIINNPAADIGSCQLQFGFFIIQELLYNFAALCRESQRRKHQKK